MLLAWRIKLKRIEPWVQSIPAKELVTSKVSAVFPLLFYNVISCFAICSARSRDGSSIRRILSRLALATAMSIDSSNRSARSITTTCGARPRVASKPGEHSVLAGYAERLRNELKELETGQQT
jgi:hypothetical protein